MRFAFAVALLVPGCFASTPQAWEMSTYKDFAAGRMRKVSLGKDGRMMLAPRLTEVYKTDQPVVWSVARTPDGATWLGTGHGGRIYRVDSRGQGSVVFTAPEPEVFALASDAQGRVYAATSPNGKVYRIENGRATEFFDPKTPYIFSLAVDRAGAVYIGTGSEGKIFRATAPGQGAVWYETGQQHVTSLAIDAQGQLLAGTDSNGLIFRVTGQGRAFTLYDADLPEIRALQAMPDGTVYAAAMGGSIAKQTTFATPAAGAATTTTSTTTSVTVTAAEESAEIQPKPTTATQSATPTPVTAATPVVEYPGVEKAALYRIGSDNRVEKLWTSTEENLYDVVASGASLYLATDNQGRIYELSPDLKVRLVTETREAEAMRLAALGNGIALVTGHVGAFYRLDDALETAGEYEAPVHDTTGISRWGKASWKGETCAGCRVALRTRTGNSARPDATWSDWSAPLTDADAAAIASPNARYIQWKAELTGAAGKSPTLDYVRLSSLTLNGAPKITTITVSSSQAAATAATATAASAPYTITVTATGDSGASSSTGTPTQSVTKASSESLVLAWVAEDPDGDKMTYAVDFRADDQRDWKPLKRDITDAALTLAADALADGRYFFRVTASDAPANAPADARSGDLTSPPVLVDRAGPAIRLTATRAEVSDTTSPLARCEYSIDAAPFAILAPTDGIVDSRDEAFTIPAVPGTGERLLAVRCYDAANNLGTARLVLR